MFLFSETCTGMMYNSCPIEACWKNKQMYEFICFSFVLGLVIFLQSVLFICRKQIQLLRKVTKTILDIYCLTMSRPHTFIIQSFPTISPLKKILQY